MGKIKNGNQEYKYWMLDKYENFKNFNREKIDMQEEYVEKFDFIIMLCYFKFYYFF
jgi:hypothetical protein